MLAQRSAPHYGVFTQPGSFYSEQLRDYTVPQGGEQTVGWTSPATLDQTVSPPVVFLNDAPVGTSNLQFTRNGIFSITASVHIVPAVDTGVNCSVFMQYISDTHPAGIFLTVQEARMPAAADNNNRDVWVTVHTCRYFGAGDEVGIILQNKDSGDSVMLPSATPSFVTVDQIA